MRLLEMPAEHLKPTSACKKADENWVSNSGGGGAKRCGADVMLGKISWLMQAPNTIVASV